MKVNNNGNKNGRGSSSGAELMGLSLRRAGNPLIASYEQVGDFDSAGTKRDGNPRILDYGDMNLVDGNPGYNGGTSKEAAPKSRRG